MGATATLQTAREILGHIGYGDNVLIEEYPVWVSEPPEVLRADLVAFAQPYPRDMSTAVVVVHLAGREPAQRVAQTLGAPFVLTPNSEGFYLSVAKPDELKFWETVSLESVAEVQQWLRPEAARQVKAGLRQLPLFDVPVDFLARAKARGSDQLGPIVGEALQSAVEALSSEDKTASEGPTRAHQEAARLVIGALTALVIRDADPPGGDEELKGSPPAGEVAWTLHGGADIYPGSPPRAKWPRMRRRSTLRRSAGSGRHLPQKYESSTTLQTSSARASTIAAWTRRSSVSSTSKRLLMTKTGASSASTTRLLSSRLACSTTCLSSSLIHSTGMCSILHAGRGPFWSPPMNACTSCNPKAGPWQSDTEI